MKFEGEKVEIDGIEYTASGVFNTDYEDLVCLDVRAPNQNIVSHLMDSVIEDLMTELILRFHTEGEFSVLGG